MIINSLISYFKSNKLPDDRLFFTRHELSSFDQQDTENIQTLNSIGDIISLFKKSPPEIFEFFNINETMAYKRKIEYFKEAISIFEKNGYDKENQQLQANSNFYNQFFFFE